MAKGKKTCPACHVDLGVRTKKCPNCNHIFQISNKKKKIETPIIRYLHETVLIPSGLPPVTITGDIDEEQIKIWFGKIIAHNESMNRTMALEGVSYWFRNYISSDPKYLEMLNNAYSEWIHAKIECSGQDDQRCN
ncbi:MAG: hypothetical protein WC942_11925 [Clostridia bacterium]